MRCHANARLSPIGRRLLVDRIERDGWSVRAAAESAGVSQRTACKWLARWRAEGPAGLLDRSSAPRRVANRTSPQTERVIAALRRLRFTAAELSELLGLPCSTVSAVCQRLGMGKLGRLGLAPAVRYERQRPGELIHIDVNKLGRIHGGAGKRITGRDRNARPRATDAAGVPRMQVGWDAVHADQVGGRSPLAAWYGAGRNPSAAHADLSPPARRARTSRGPHAVASRALRKPEAFRLFVGPLIGCSICI